MKDTASAQVLKNVVPGATLKNFTTPKEALDAFYTGDVSILGGGTLASSETNACRFGTQIPTQVLLEHFEEGPPLTPLTPNPSGA